MKPPTYLFSWSFAGTGLLCLSAGCLSACLFDDTPREPSIEGHFGNRLEGLPPRALLDSSYLALGLMRGISGDSYEYETGYHDFLGGGGKLCQVTFRAGAPAQKECRVIDAHGEETGTVETPADWSGLKDTRREPLPAPVPLDTFYAECRILLDDCAAPATPYFAYDYNYILFSCGCRDSSYADGYPSVTLSRLRWSRD